MFTKKSIQTAYKRAAAQSRETRLREGNNPHINPQRYAVNPPAKPKGELPWNKKERENLTGRK